MGRRAAVFLHAQDVDNVRKGKSNTLLTQQTPSLLPKPPAQQVPKKSSKKLATSQPKKKSNASMDSMRSSSADQTSDTQRQRRKSMAISQVS